MIYLAAQSKQCAGVTIGRAIVFFRGVYLQMKHPAPPPKLLGDISLFNIADTIICDVEKVTHNIQICKLFAQIKNIAQNRYLTI